MPARASRARPVQRRKRGSKVVETILEALKDGEADIPALKSGLSKAGLSENSLSTGLAILQKDGRVKRNGDGVYASGECRVKTPLFTLKT